MGFKVIVFLFHSVCTLWIALHIVVEILSKQVSMVMHQPPSTSA